MSGDCKDCGEKLTTCCLNCFEEQLDYKAPREAASLRQQRDALRDSLAFIVECFLQSESEQVGDCEGRTVTLIMGEIDEMRAALSQCERGDGEGGG